MLHIAWMNGAPAPIDTAPAVAPAPVPPLNAPPVASFAANCPKGRCTFDATASTASPEVASYAWDFGDGSTATAGAGVPTAAYSYKAPGSYRVVLRVSDRSGRTATAATTVTVRRVN
jgi:PKD repeat protein